MQRVIDPRSTRAQVPAADCLRVGPDFELRRSLEFEEKTKRGHEALGLEFPDGERMKCYQGVSSKMAVIVSESFSEKFGWILHVSVSFPHRLPTWEELKKVKEAFFGNDRDVMMVLPSKDKYFNLHNFCMHLWEMPEEWDRQIV